MGLARLLILFSTYGPDYLPAFPRNATMRPSINLLRIGYCVTQLPQAPYATRNTQYGSWLLISFRDQVPVDLHDILVSAAVDG